MRFGKSQKKRHVGNVAILKNFVSVNMIENEDPKKHEYWKGWQNKLIRYFYYLNRGVDIFNQFKYLFALIFGIYFTFKLRNPMVILIMTGISLPLLMIFGYLQTHRIGKVNDWLNVKFSTFYGKLQFELLQKIIDELKILNDKKNI